ncbi:ABC transporter permease [Patescibacteria group bacterium]|nr:ABC transporter permease [Patescibacteria group bacterium]
MFTNIYRLIKYSFQSFWRQKLLSFATMVVILLVLMVFQGIFIFGAIGDSALQSIKDKIDVSLFFAVDAPEDEILAVKADVEGLDVVKEVEYISRAEALELFRARHTSDETITQALDELDENPLSASLNIKTKETEQLPVVAAYLNNLVPEHLVDEVSYNEDNKAIIDRLTAIITASEVVGIILALFLAIVAVLVVFNTVLLGIYSNRDEISIMRWVGASNIFIRGPFMGLGVIYGFLTATIVMIASIPIVYMIAPYVVLFVPDFDLVVWFSSHFILLYLSQIAISVGIGIISSIIAVNRYLDA